MELLRNTGWSYRRGEQYLYRLPVHFSSHNNYQRAKLYASRKQLPALFCIVSWSGLIIGGSSRLGIISALYTQNYVVWATR